MAGIVRRFGPVTALDGADLDLRAGEVHGVLGENGAGKTTLLNILGGLLTPDGGRIEVRGDPVAFATPRDAWRHGIGMVHQHFKLVPALTVLENLSLGLRTGGRGFRLPYHDVRRRLGELSAETGLRVESDRPVSQLGVGERQRVEILKALLRSPEILVLDEPTAVLTPPETEALFELIRGLAAAGCAVVLVAHKLDEVMAVGDRFTVLRDGRSVVSGDRDTLGVDDLVNAMVGRGPDTVPSEALPSDSARRPRERPGRTPGPVVASLHGVGVRRPDGAWALRDVTLEVRRGELVGVAGVQGNGQRELAAVLAGRLGPEEGSVRLPFETGFVAQDRSTEGLIGAFTLVENVALAHHDRPPGHGALMPWADLRRRAEGIRARFGVRAPSVDVPASSLSGGNQQRLMVGREMEIASALLVAENPTRGLDLGATAFVRRELLRHLEGGVEPPGVVLVSSDLDEVLELADRVFVMVRGRLIEVPEARRTRSGVAELMLAAGAPA
jgi:simple sugar transport system ATP-binding protein